MGPIPMEITQAHIKTRTTETITTLHRKCNQQEIKEAKGQFFKNNQIQIQVRTRFLPEGTNQVSYIVLTIFTGRGLNVHVGKDSDDIEQVHGGYRYGSRNN